MTAVNTTTPFGEKLARHAFVAQDELEAVERQLEQKRPNRVLICLHLMVARERLSELERSTNGQVDAYRLISDLYGPLPAVLYSLTEPRSKKWFGVGKVLSHAALRDVDQVKLAGDFEESYWLLKQLQSF